MPPSDDNDAKTVADAIDAMKAAMRSERQARLQARLADAINAVPDIARLYTARILSEITELSIDLHDDRHLMAAAVLAAVVHDDAKWDAVVQVRQLIEALRGKKDQP